MSVSKQPVNMDDQNPDRITKQHVAHRGGTGIGGGLVGAAIGGLLGRRVGGVFGCVVGTAAGALVGKGTAQRINRAISTIESVADAAKSVTEAVNDSVSDVGNALKDTVEEVKPSVVSVVNAVRDTVYEVKPSVVDAANNVAEAVKQTVSSVESALKDTLEQVTANSVESAVKDTVESVKPGQTNVEAVKDTVESVKPSQTNVEAVKDIEQVELFNNHNSKLDEPLVTVQPLKSSQELFFNNAVKQQPKQKLNYLQPYNNPNTDVKAIEYNNIQQRQEEFQHNQQETAYQPKPQKITLQSDKIQTISGIIVGAVTITFMGVSLGLSPKEKFLGTQALDFNQSISPTVDKPETVNQGWIFLGNINNAPDSTLIGKPLIKGSQFTNSPVVPSVGSIVTVTVKPGIRLRKNKPSSANFNYKEEALAVLKPQEKLKILQVESLTSNNTPLAKKVWAKVHRCDTACN
jgi:vacuolar-type H+-ATPase subunit E/Vma4